MKICKVIIVFILTLVVCSPTQSVANPGGAAKKLGGKILDLVTDAGNGKPKAPNGGDAATEGGPRNPRVSVKPSTDGELPNSHNRPEISDDELHAAEAAADTLPDELLIRETFKDFQQHEVPFVTSNVKPEVLDAMTNPKSDTVHTTQHIKYEIPDGVEQTVGELGGALNFIKEENKHKTIKRLELVNHDYKKKEIPQSVKVIATTRGNKPKQAVILAPAEGKPGNITINDNGEIILPPGAIAVGKREYDSWLQNKSKEGFYMEDGIVYHSGVKFGNPHWSPD